MSDVRIQADAGMLIVFDADLAPQVGPSWFDPAHWHRNGQPSNRPTGGRVTAHFIETPAGAGVLRHYHRGGMVAPVLGDRYLWTGFERTRAAAEFRLLDRLYSMGLPVPRPVAACCVRHGLGYTADLITLRIAPAQTLAERITSGTLDAGLAGRVGALVARFHNHGVWHADLNAHNILIGPQSLYLIDFDRGRLRSPAHAWQQANLARLERSLVKLGAARDGKAAFEYAVWTPLMRAYASALERQTGSP